MPSVTVRNQAIFVGERAVPLLGGEVHYWRLNPKNWKTILSAVRDIGLDVISTYIPWDYHEFEKGHFDFTGRTDPQRNLLGFLELTRKEKFWLLIRPGPYIYSEWPRDGVPTYAFKYHRLHPRFLEWARSYLWAVTEVIKPYQATRRGGHIVALQADNEIDCWPDRFGAQYGLGSKPGLFQKFLKSKYGTVKNLNTAWASTNRKFEDAGPFMSRMVDLDGDSPRGFPLKGDPELRRNLDFFEFKHGYARTYAAEVIAEYKRLGIDVPIYLNTYPFFYAHDWNSLQEEADFVGIDVYAHNEFSEHKAEHRRTLDKFRYAAETSRLAFIAEFGAGVWHPQHYHSGAMTPNHYRMAAASAVIGGIKGWNWYMLVNRDNWYMSPLDEWGRPRGELTPVFKSVTRACREMNLPACEKLTRVGATYNTMQYAAKTAPGEGSTLAALYDADIDYRLFNPEHQDVKTPILFYAGNHWISEKAQARLKQYVQNGGVLVAFQEWPRKNDYFRPLKAGLFDDPDRNLFEFKRSFRIRLGKEMVDVTSTVMTFRKPKGLKIEVDLGEEFGTNCVGYVRPFGRGKILHLGIEPGSDMILAVLRYFQIPVFCRSLTPAVKTALLSNGDRRFLALVHNGEENKTADIEVPYLSKSGRKCTIRNLFSGKIEAASSPSSPHLSLPVRRKDGCLYEIQPA
ncbi:MAG: beta-galactosidase [Candidatus Omnitrophica bacterium]|nr:beta-galactosidase [Candidatus Omnitrophota bacterium]